ncbi:hypothetical protein GCM10010519_66640 [Streptomyces lactacystinicus]
MEAPGPFPRADQGLPAFPGPDRADRVRPVRPMWPAGLTGPAGPWVNPGSGGGRGTG